MPHIRLLPLLAVLFALAGVADAGVADARAGHYTWSCEFAADLHSSTAKLAVLDDLAAESGEAGPESCPLGVVISVPTPHGELDDGEDAA